MLLWTFVAVIVAAILILCTTFEAVARGQIVILTPWMKEVLASFFWFSAVFRTMNYTYKDLAEQRDYMAGRQRLIGILIVLHVVSVYLARFALNQSLLVAYLGTLFLFAVIPLYGFYFIFPLVEKHRHTARVSAKTLHQLALFTREAQEFIHHFPRHETFVVGHSRKNLEAKCLFLYRHPRPELPDLWEDVVLEIPISLDKREVRFAGMQWSHYVFRNGEAGSTVVPLSVQGPLNESNLDAPLDPQVVVQFEIQPERYPRLVEVPLRLAVGGELYEKVV